MELKLLAAGHIRKNTDHTHYSNREPKNFSQSRSEENTKDPVHHFAVTAKEYLDLIWAADLIPVI